jgi:flagellar FliJ protein
VSRRTKKIGKVVSLTKSEERRYGVQTGRSQHYLSEQIDKLGELQAYRQAYTTRAPAGGRVHIAHLQDYQNFLQRLDRAVQSQQQIVRDGERNLAAHRQRWLAKRQRLESLQRVLSRYRVQDRICADRLEQKRLDDVPSKVKTVFHCD